MSGMKAISLWQPFASLVAWGDKRYETRSWHPRNQLQPGELFAMHAAKRKPTGNEIDSLVTYTPLVECMKRQQIKRLIDLPYGEIVAFCRLVAVHRSEDIRTELSEQERAFGDYGYGRFAWELEVVKLPARRVAVRGQQGIWWFDFDEVEDTTE